MHNSVGLNGRLLILRFFNKLEIFNNRQVLKVNFIHNFSLTFISQRFIFPPACTGGQKIRRCHLRLLTHKYIGSYMGYTHCGARRERGARRSVIQFKQEYYEVLHNKIMNYS